MKKIIIAASLLIAGLTLSAHAQILTPVRWSYAAKKINNQEALLFIRATIDDNWHLYSQFVKEGGPVKTTFTFSPSKSYTLDGPAKEPAPVTRFEKVFNMDVSFFEHEVVFQQKIRLKAKNVTVKGQLEYMTCNDKKCLPPEMVDFTITVK